MPRDLGKELVELKQGLHQFVMSMYVIIDKLVEEEQAKSQVVKVLQDEIRYIQSDDEGVEDTQHLIDKLKEHRQALAKNINIEKDDSRRFDMMQAYQGLDTFIRYIDE